MSPSGESAVKAQVRVISSPFVSPDPRLSGYPEEHPDSVAVVEAELLRQQVPFKPISLPLVSDTPPGSCVFPIRVKQKDDPASTAQTAGDQAHANPVANAYQLTSRIQTAVDSLFNAKPGKDRQKAFGQVTALLGEARRNTSLPSGFAEQLLPVLESVERHYRGNNVVRDKFKTDTKTELSTLLELLAPEPQEARQAS